MKYFLCLFLLVISASSVAGTFVNQGSLDTDVIVSIYEDDSDIASFVVEIASTEQLREQGLMNRQSLDLDRGMLFIFPDEDIRYFWMKNTYIPLDIIYLNKQKRIVHIARNAKPHDLTFISSKKPSKYALEINAGLADKLGIQSGQKMRIE